MCQSENQKSEMRVKNKSQIKESKDLFKNEPTNIKGIPQYESETYVLESKLRFKAMNRVVY